MIKQESEGLDQTVERLREMLAQVARQRAQAAEAQDVGAIEEDPEKRSSAGAEESALREEPSQIESQA